LWCFGVKAGKHTYKIERVDFEKTPLDEFEWGNGSKITIMEYFSCQYQTEIKDMNQSLLVSKNIRNGQEIYLDLEIDL
jgi:hypothetical protein